jgi:biopolymer transport protein ExbB
MLNGLDLIFKGGIMMIPLLITSVVGLAIIFERLYIYNKKYYTPKSFVFNILEQVQKGHTEASLEECRKISTPVASVLASGIAHLKNPIEEMELAMKNEGESWMPSLEKWLHVLDTIITVAPMMGLLGTIMGMMSAFKVLSMHGVDKGATITGDIGVALIATATGLIVALICVIAFNYLNTRIKNFIYEMESSASRLVEVRLANDRHKR